MLWHDLSLAWRSLARTPWISGLMIGAIAVGIAASMITITLYHARAGHPIPWKNDTLYAVTLDTRDDTPPQSYERHPEYPPTQVGYQDAKALYASKIPVHAVMMFQASQIVTPAARGVKPFGVSVRVTTADFFSTFDAPFVFGTGWARTDDADPGAVVVLSKYLNQKLFGGANSVGREVVLDGHAYRVVGVLAAWMPRPRFYDMNNDNFAVPEDAYIPFGWMEARKIRTNGNTNCVSMHAKIENFDSFLTQECVWLQYWVQLRGRADRDRFQAFVDSYADDQRHHGRFPRPRNNNRVVDVPTWLAMNDVVGDDSRMQLVLGFVFLGVCVLNTLGLLLAKFLGAAPVSGLRRALGARRIDIVRQHIVEVTLVGLLGGAGGVLLTYGGLAGLKGLMLAGQLNGVDNPDQVAMVQSLTHMDTTVLALAIALSLLTGLLAGLYPAWRIGRLAPASFLKTH